MRKRKPLSVDLFCGIGGLTVGLSRAGIQSVGGVDNWRDAKLTFEHNLAPLKCLEADLRSVSAEDLEGAFGFDRAEVDIVVGGPPCQGFSTVGKRTVKDPRNDLWRHFLRLVVGLKPKFILMENVEGLVVANRGGIRDQILHEFGQAGYRMKCSLLRAADFGVPQLRKRVIFLGWQDGLEEPNFPGLRLVKHVTVAQAIGDLPALMAGESASTYEAAPFTDYQRARRKNCPILHNHAAANHPDHLIEVLRYIPDGGNRKAIPPELQPKSGFHNSYARLASDKPAIAVTSNMRKPSSARATHPTQHRGLTVREGLRLQSFDDDFVVLGSRTSQYLQVGNAVPPLLAEALGRELVKAWEASLERNLGRREPQPVNNLFDEELAVSQLSLV